MAYSTDAIYKKVGREDGVAVLTLDSESPSAKKFSDSLTVVFVYDPKVREKLELNFQNGIDENTSNKMFVRFLLGELSKEQIQRLEKEGIHSTEINNIYTGNWPAKNPFYSNETRRLEKLEIQIKIEPKGRDYDWMYGFARRRLKDGIGLAPDEMNFYYAAKFYYEPHKITDEEKKVMYSDGVLNPEIEFKLIKIKIEREEEEEKDWVRYGEICSLKGKNAMELISRELISAGTSIKLLFQKDSKLLWEIYFRIANYRDRQLNVMGKIPIYLDAEGFLHIYFRHVVEYRVSEHFNDKDKFQWEEKEVLRVIDAVILSLDKEIQEFWIKSPGTRFSKYGIKSYYYEGDYYTFHIEADGRLSTFHKIRKNIN